MTRKYKQGYYDVKNVEKYCGTKTHIRYLSSYELRFFEWCDRCTAIIKWSAETVIVPYHNPLKGKMCRYIVDIYFKYTNKHGVVCEELVEIKPSAQCKRPNKGKKSEKTYQSEMATWIVNQAKWQAAKKYAEERSWNFRIITENSLFRG
ncbi:head completion [Alishewanella phage vB_AspM_Slickus01]|nr:head completion [Alishewanella phage vB_AspM_Slicko01]WGH49775.1 head completion [Alishewanella phage vB_AspM_Slickus01]